MKRALILITLLLGIPNLSFGACRDDLAAIQKNYISLQAQLIDSMNLNSTYRFTLTTGNCGYCGLTDSRRAAENECKSRGGKVIEAVSGGEAGEFFGVALCRIKN